MFTQTQLIGKIKSCLVKLSLDTFQANYVHTLRIIACFPKNIRLTIFIFVIYHLFCSSLQ